MKINIYRRDGKLIASNGLTNQNLTTISGMLSRVILKDGTYVEGYADPLRLEGFKEEYDGTVHDYIYLWTFNNLDEKYFKYNVKDGINIKKVVISDIVDIHSISHSHPRWSGPLTNKFWIKLV